MPRSAPKYCSHPSCPRLVYSPDNRCPEHKTQHRRSRTGDSYNDTAWRRFRAVFLVEHPLCADCEAKGIYTAANEVHHIRKVSEYPELKFVEAWVLALCKPCHSMRTQKGE